MAYDELYGCCRDRLARLESRADDLAARAGDTMARLDACEDAGGRYALVLEEDGFEFLIEVARLWKPPSVVVRRGEATAEFWLDEDDVSVVVTRGLSRFGERRVAGMVRQRLEDLLDAWYGLREDVRQGRLSKRNVLVD